MDRKLRFEDLPIGSQWKSPKRTITESDVLSFAGLTGDFNPLHVDPEFARNTPFRQPIAHGLLGISFMAGLSSHSPLVDTEAFLGIKEWYFLKPIFFGDTIYVVNEVIDKQSKNRRRGIIAWQRTLFNQNDVMVQQGIIETLVATIGKSNTALPEKAVHGKATVTMPAIPHNVVPTE